MFDFAKEIPGGRNLFSKVNAVRLSRGGNPSMLIESMSPFLNLPEGQFTGKSIL